MKKKTVCFAVFFAILLAGFLIYFMPMPLSDCLGESSQITITLNEIGIRDGEPFIDPISYPEITEEQKDSIFRIVQSILVQKNVSHNILRRLYVWTGRSADLYFYQW
ncbi:hypothetical protein MR578_03865 [bacterium]|nr:hypothetical protein [bacterium]